MHIEEIIIDGFKSYATRTVIAGFDANFNAITGLNGSGKSNILDAICFVLGISNLSQVRVNNLQELVYKQGQAGVTKASVTIVFNNEDRKSSPVGYEQYDKITVTRQVVIGGRNKYLINGHNAQLNRVQNLFHSVQLNVNNPHFLIMQGRITKVLNMKPPEILAMIEEAAGTRMFEMKKVAALKTIEKKQKKVDEIERILTEEITPTLDNLRKERAQYIQWSNNQTQIERLSRFCTAFAFSKAQITLQRSSDELDEMQDKLQELEKQKGTWSSTVGENKIKISKLTDQKEKEMDSDFKKLDSKAEELSKELIKQKTAYQHKKEVLDQEHAQLAKNYKAIEVIKTDIQKGKDRVKADQEALTHVEEENKTLSTKYKDLQKQSQDALAGIASEGVSDSATVADQIMEAKRDATNAESEIKKSVVKIRHLESELSSKRKAVQITDNEFKKLELAREIAEKELSLIKKKMDALQFDENGESPLNQKREELIKVESLREKVNTLTAELSNVQVSFSDPSLGFDRSKVKGVVAKLATVKDSQWATALEVAAGGRLYNLVVDTETTSKALLDKNCLTRKTTMIPLNKITAHTLDPQKMRTAEKLVGPDNVQLALMLVEYDHEVQNAMKYVFGNTLICPSSDDAKKVTFDKQVNTRSVTKQGDLYDPAGSLTGGSRSSNRALLDRLQELKEAEETLKQHIDALTKIDARLKVSEAYSALKHEYQLKAHEVELIDARMQQNPYYHLSASVHDLEAQLTLEQSAIDSLQKRLKAAEVRHKELTQHEQDFKGRRDNRLKNLEKQIEDTKKKLAASTAQLKTGQQDSVALVLESGELESELHDLEQDALTTKNSIAKLSKEVSLLEEQTTRIKTEYENAREQADRKREKIQSQSQVIQELIQDTDKLSKKITDADLEVKKIEHKVSRFNKEQKDAAKFVQHMEKQYQWIAAEKQFFGKPKTDYDFQAQDPEKAEKRLLALQEEQDTLSKSINKKVMSMFEKAEQEFQDLKHKKKIIENDKAKIEAVIAELDEKKTEALNTTWQKVNKDFGSIFSTLLPGTKAKLEPPQGQTVMEGLQVKVAFGDVWKESLVDLSGGQRSLLALSLILSLLLFKPAPMYILDEIDAALDLSHTQNIGQMLKTHFTHSQFIIVSLKEGMFNNANVLFETKFIDGVSTVYRTTPRSQPKFKAK